MSPEDLNRHGKKATAFLVGAVLTTVVMIVLVFSTPHMFGAGMATGWALTSLAWGLSILVEKALHQWRHDLRTPHPEGETE